METDMEVKGVTGTIRFDGRAITIVRKGFAARITVGKGDKRIPLSQITAVQFKPSGPFVRGFIEFTLAGGNERRSRFGQQTEDAVSDENSVVFGHSQRKQFIALREAIEQALDARSEAPPAPSASDERGTRTLPTPRRTGPENDEAPASAEASRGGRD